MGRIMGIDYGLKRTGIAVTDPLKIIASALITVPTAELPEFLKRYCAGEDVEAFVVGLPLQADGTPAQIAPQIDALVEKLGRLFPGRPVVRQDERYTSHDAKRIMLQSGMKQKQRRDKREVDKIAAALILEQYMYEHHWK
jgi:putative Holliday junction resolvase